MKNQESKLNDLARFRNSDGAKHGLEQILTVFCVDWDVSNYLVSSVAFYTPVL